MKKGLFLLILLFSAFAFQDIVNVYSDDSYETKATDLKQGDTAFIQVYNDQGTTNEMYFSDQKVVLNSLGGGIYRGTTVVDDKGALVNLAIIVDLDKDGQYGVYSLKIDNEPPKASLTLSENRIPKDGKITAKALVQDNVAVNKVTFFVNNVSWEPTKKGEEYVFDVESGREGNNTISVRVTDSVGNVFETENQVYVVDVVGPSFSELMPEANAILQNTDVCVKVTDESGVQEDSQEIFLDNQKINFTLENQRLCWKGNLENGQHRVTVSATDQLNNSRTLEWVFTIDTENPLPPKLTAPEFVNKNEVELNFAGAKDENGIKKYFIQKNVGEGFFDYTETTNTNLVDDELLLEAEYKVITEDNAGNKAESNVVKVKVDKTIPVIEEIRIKKMDGRVFVAAKVSEDNELDYCNFVVGGTSYREKASYEEGLYLGEVTGIQNGEYETTFVCVDKANNVQTEKKKLVFSDEEPLVSFIKPSENQIFNYYDTVTIMIRSDKEITCDYKIGDKINRVGKGTEIQNTFQAVDIGPQEMLITCYDGSGNEVSETKNFLVKQSSTGLMTGNPLLGWGLAAIIAIVIIKIIFDTKQIKTKKKITEKEE